jgi:hypothetical protein
VRGAPGKLRPAARLEDYRPVPRAAALSRRSEPGRLSDGLFAARRGVRQHDCAFPRCVECRGPNCQVSCAAKLATLRQLGRMHRRW